MSKLTDKQMRTLTRGKEDWLRLVQENPKAFGNFNGFNDLTEIHNDWLKEIVFGTRDYTLQAHRGSYKSTTLAIGIALIMICKKQRRKPSELVHINDLHLYYCGLLTNYTIFA